MDVLKRILSAIAVVSVGFLLASCGNEEVKPVVEESITDEEMETLFETPTTTFGQIEVPTEDIASKREPLFTFERAAEILQGYIGQELTPQSLYDMFMVGYDVTTDPEANTHEYFFYELEDQTGNWIRVRFNENDTVVEEVETNLPVSN